MIPYSLQSEGMVALAVHLLIGASWEETAWYLGIHAGHNMADTDDFWIKAGG